MDNCPSTNKNNYAMAFFYHLVHKLKICEEIVIICMIPGHTKFSCDRFFGTIKNKLNHYSDDIESYPDAVKFIKDSVDNSFIYSTSEIHDKDNFVRIYDFRVFFEKYYEKISSTLKFFKNYYYRIVSKLP